MDGAVAASVAAAVAASIAAIASAVAAWQTWRLADAESERRKEEQAEAKRAWLIANYISDRESTWLQIQNVGPAVARDVDLSIHPPLQAMDLSKMPAELTPFQVVTLKYRHVPHQSKDLITLLRWTDGEGDRRWLEVPPGLVPLAAAQSAEDQRKVLRRMAWQLSR